MASRRRLDVVDHLESACWLGTTSFAYIARNPIEARGRHTSWLAMLVLAERGPAAGVPNGDGLRYFTR